MISPYAYFALPMSNNAHLTNKYNSRYMFKVYKWMHILCGMCGIIVLPYIPYINYDIIYQCLLSNQHA